jgi:DNA-binding NarL/FixJ family response regulator
VIRVFIVAASSLSRAGMQSLLRNPSVNIVGSTPSFESFEGHWPGSEADVVLIQTSSEEFDALIAYLAASQFPAESAIAILSDHLEPAQITEALRAGVRAVLPDDIAAEQLVPALDAVTAGLTVVHPSEVAALLPAARSASRALGELAEPLTPREREVLQMLAGGLANKEIATRLGISDHTVKFHVASILGKLGAGSRTEAVSLGIRRGLVLL